MAVAFQSADPAPYPPILVDDRDNFRESVDATWILRISLDTKRTRIFLEFYFIDIFCIFSPSLEFRNNFNY